MEMSTAEIRHLLDHRLERLVSTLHHALAVVGVLTILSLLISGNQLLSDLGASRPTAFGPIRYDGNAVFAAADEDNPKYRALASYLSRRYRVATDATEQLVSTAYDVGQQVGLDPLLILAVVAVESRFNPIAESVVGAKGLMQVVPKHHQDKLLEHGGEEAVLDPMTNILLGARILKEYIRRTGSLEAGLQFYNGALSDPSSQYAQKVFAEKERLQQAVRRFDRVGARSTV
jgi:soluble lytic murein transglycosylase-like protein